MDPNARTYLRDIQYRTPDRLAARARLHTRYGSGDWYAWLADAVALTPGERCADIGCGAGAFWREALAIVPDDLSLWLIDLSPGMIEAARSAVAGKRWHAVHALVADAIDLPLDDGSVDVVLAIHMLYHLADPERGLAEMRRVLAPDGRAAIVLNTAGTMAELHDLVTTATGERSGAVEAPLTSHDALRMLERQFAHVRTLRYDDTLIVTDPADLAAYLLSLPVADRQENAERLTAAVDRVFLDGGAFRITKSTDLFLCDR